MKNRFYTGFIICMWITSKGDQRLYQHPRAVNYTSVENEVREDALAPKMNAGH